MSGPGAKAAQGIPVSLLGTLRVGPHYENGLLSSLYELQGEKMELPDQR